LSALTADNHGLADLEFIIAHAPEYLASGGWLLVEHGYDQGSAVRDLFAANQFDELNTFRDYGGNERVTVGRIQKALDPLRGRPAGMTTPQSIVILASCP
jgi:release factor glutamine methyltransferase